MCALTAHRREINLTTRPAPFGATLGRVDGNHSAPVSVDVVHGYQLLPLAGRSENLSKHEGAFQPSANSWLAVRRVRRPRGVMMDHTHLPPVNKGALNEHSHIFATIPLEQDNRHSGGGHNWRRCGVNNFSAPGPRIAECGQYFREANHSSRRGGDRINRWRLWHQPEPRRLCKRLVVVSRARHGNSKPRWSSLLH